MSQIFREVANPSPGLLNSLGGNPYVAIEDGQARDSELTMEIREKRRGYVVVMEPRTFATMEDAQAFIDSLPEDTSEADAKEADAKAAKEDRDAEAEAVAKAETTEARAERAKAPEPTAEPKAPREPKPHKAQAPGPALPENVNSGTRQPYRAR